MQYAGVCQLSSQEMGQLRESYTNKQYPAAWRGISTKQNYCFFDNFSARAD
jgi:hypothetical protein